MWHRAYVYLADVSEEYTDSIFRIERKIKTFVDFSVVTKKAAVFWELARCKCGVSRRFGGTYRLHLRGIREYK
jgi:hypothetical protein